MQSSEIQPTNDEHLLGNQDFSLPKIASSPIDIPTSSSKESSTIVVTSIAPACITPIQGTPTSLDSHINVSDADTDDNRRVCLLIYIHLLVLYQLIR